MPLQHPRNPIAHSRLAAAADEVFTSETSRVPKHELPAGEMRDEVAYQIVHDELMLDGNARLNLATFVTTYMDPHADKLMAETFDKNMIDKDEYPQTAAMEMRCVNMLSRLFNSPEPRKATGCSTTGSSEAAMLGGLALKRKWQQRRKAEGKPTDKPNLVTGINVQVCWDKFANYWDVEMRLVPMEGERYHVADMLLSGRSHDARGRGVQLPSLSRWAAARRGLPPGSAAECARRGPPPEVRPPRSARRGSTAGRAGMCAPDEHLQAHAQ